MEHIYLDHASTTKLKKEVYQEMEPFLTENYCNPSSLYDEGISNKKVINSCRKKIAKLINANSKEIYFCSGGSEANNWAIKGVAFNSKNKKNIITTKIEHHSLMHSCLFLAKLGFNIKYVDVDSKGFVNVDHLNSLIDENTLIVSIILANNEIGTIQDIKSISEVCKQKDVILHIDAVQALGHIPIDLDNLDLDMLSVSAHKFNGPKGVGFLYIKNGLDIENLIHGGKQEYGKRSGTENVANIVGMSKALQIAYENMEKQAIIQRDLAQLLLNNLISENIDFKLNGPSIGKHRLPGNINISFKNLDGSLMCYLLNKKGICVSTGSACNEGLIESSHVLQAIKVAPEFIKGTIRITLGEDTTSKEINILSDAIVDIIRNKKV